MRLVLIRHAESEWNVHGDAARGDTGLTPLGVEQARNLVRRLRAAADLGECSALLASPSPRARETAQIVIDALPVDAVLEDADLCEMNDLTSETLEEFLERVRTALARLLERYAGKTVVAVSHAGFIMASILVLFDIPPRARRARLDPDHVSLTEWQVSDGVWRLEHYNVRG